MSDSPNRAQEHLQAARKEAFQQTAKTNSLKTVLLIIGIVGLVLLAALYITNHPTASAPGTAHSAQDEEALRKVIALEKELQLLKVDLAPPKAPDSFVAVTQSVAEFLIANWVLLSFVVAVLTAIYVKLRFKVDYFESYREVSTKKKLSSFYEKLGDRMMIYGEWEAAESAYRSALEINPTNSDASYGVAKASLFQPQKGQKFYAPEVAEAKLDYLIANPPKENKNEAQLYFLKGMNRSLQGDDAAARQGFEKAIEVDSSSVGSYLMLGYLHQGSGEIESSIACLKKALEIDPSYSLANNNLGFNYLLNFQFDKAITSFELAGRISPNALSTMNLGNAYCYKGDFAEALRLHKFAAANLEVPEIEKERYVGGQWMHNFMPLHPGDKVTIKKSVKLFTFEQKKMLALFALAFDYALTGDLTKANETFSQCRTLDPAGDYREFFLNRMQSLVNYLKPAPPAADWFAEKIKELSQ